MKALSFLTDEERTQVETEVAKQERRTAAEFVCAVATESGRYDRSESVVGLFGALLCLAVVYEGPTIWANLITDGGSWNQGERFGLFGLAIAVVVGTVIGQLVGTWLPELRRPFVGAREKEEEVSKAAASLFAQQRLSGTEARGGILLYLSLFERRVVILCDQAARKVLREEDLMRLRDLAVTALKEGRKADAFLDPLRTAGDILAERLPPDGEPSEELPNDLVLLHPRP